MFRAFIWYWDHFVFFLAENPILSFLITPWFLAMISIPILRWTIGELILPWGVAFGVVLQVAAVLSVLRVAWGGKRTVQIVALVLPLAWLIEFVGSRTGFPFGAYRYTATLQPQLGGVPLLIPLAWLMMLPCAWAVGMQICELRITNYDFAYRHSTLSPCHLVTLSKHPLAFIQFVLISAAAFTAWDFFLDPQMVAWGYWVWEQPGGYFGIPWVNFVGWFGASALITALVFTIYDLRFTIYDLRHSPLATRHSPLVSGSFHLIFIYAATWLLQTIGQLVFWNMPGPALVGFVAMGLFVGLTMNRRQRCNA